MNGMPLSFGHGAPPRLRNETQLGFKQVKWIKGVEFVADFSDISGGYGGYKARPRILRLPTIDLGQRQRDLDVVDEVVVGDANSGGRGMGTEASVVHEVHDVD